MQDDIINYLLSAAGKSKQEVLDDNPFREIAFDGDKPRLGWVDIPAFEEVKQAVEKFEEYAAGKKKFVFVGMGGSINGVKAVIESASQENIYTLDSLDPQALQNLISSLGNLENTLIIGLSKSATTKETRLILESLSDLFANEWNRHFLFLTDPSSQQKLVSTEWKNVPMLNLQADKKDDIGGRFSSPNTLVFILPLYITLGRKIDKLRDFWFKYVQLNETIIKEAYSLAFKGREKTLFCLGLKKNTKGLLTWAVQLFQESLGSKKDGFSPKTFSIEDALSPDKCLNLNFSPKIEDKLLYLAAYMRFLQFVVAFYAYLHRVNFVTQPYVEIYKKKLKELENQDVSINKVSLNELIGAVKSKIKPEQKFIEAVLYCYQPEWEREIEKVLKNSFPGKTVLIFRGSDWNHHSYQAAFLDKNTFYLILTRQDYIEAAAGVKKEKISQNIAVLKAIAYATYKTLEDKAFLGAISLG